MAVHTERRDDPGKSRTRISTYYDSQYLEATWHRACSRADATDNVEGVPDAPLGPNRCERFLYGGGLDPCEAAAVRRAILFGPVYSTCDSGRHRQVSEWIVDGTDRAEPNRCG